MILSSGSEFAQSLPSLQSFIYFLVLNDHLVP